MKKILLILIVFTLCGCTKINSVASNNESSNVTEITENATTEEVKIEILITEALTTEEATTEIQLSDDELNLMQLALLSKVKIIDTEDGVKKNVTELPYYFEGMDFRYVDLDGDGKNEVVLQPPMQGSILHEINGTIYRYPITNRISYHEDGTIYGSSGADYSYLFRIKFNETECWDEVIYYAIKGKVYMIYEYEGEQIEFTEEEFAMIQEQYPNIKSEIYEFNHNNIAIVLSEE